MNYIRKPYENIGLLLNGRPVTFLEIVFVMS
jgi:hypothetical protein